MTTSKGIPMSSRVLDAVAVKSRWYQSLGPVTLDAIETNSFMHEILLIEGVIRRLATLAIECRTFEHHQITPTNVTTEVTKTAKTHTHLVPGDRSITIGPLSFANCRLSQVIAVDGTTDLAQILTISCHYTVMDSDGEERSELLFERQLTVLSATHYLVYLAPSLYNCLGSLLKEIASTAFKGVVDDAATSAAAIAAIMRLQDDSLKQLCSKAESVNVSDNKGISTGITAYDARSKAQDDSLLILSRLCPTIYNWIFNGEPLGTKMELGVV